MEEARRLRRYFRHDRVQDEQRAERPAAEVEADDDLEPVGAGAPLTVAEA